MSEPINGVLIGPNAPFDLLSKLRQVRLLGKCSSREQFGQQSLTTFFNPFALAVVEDVLANRDDQKTLSVEYFEGKSEALLKRG